MTFQFPCFERESILLNPAIDDRMLIRSNFPAILNSLQPTQELFIGPASHVLGALGGLQRGLMIDPELPSNFITASERAIDPVLTLAVIGKFAALPAAETAGVSVSPWALYYTELFELQ
jgi:hypothetical protein